MNSKDCNFNEYFSTAKERHLIRAAQSGDTAARDELLLAALPFAERSFASFFREMGKDSGGDDFEDLVQEAVPILCDCIDRYDLNHPARARLYVFASRYLRRAAVNHIRHSMYLKYSGEMADVAGEETTEDSLLTTQIEALVRKILATMSIRDQDLLLSRHAREKKATRAEMAERYGCPAHIIEYAEKRARKRFSKALRASRPLAARA